MQNLFDKSDRINKVQAEKLREKMSNNEALQNELFEKAQSK